MKSKIISCVCTLAITVVIVCGTTFAASFPTDKGSVMVAGAFSFENEGGNLHEEDGDRVTKIEFMPVFLYFVTPGLGLGGILYFDRTAHGDKSATGLGIGPHLIYFIGGNKPKSTVKGTTYPFVRASFLYLRYTRDYGYKDITFSGTQISFGGGIIHMLSETVGLHGGAEYQIANMKPEEGDSERGDCFSIDAGFAVFLY